MTQQRPLESIRREMGEKPKKKWVEWLGRSAEFLSGADLTAGGVLALGMAALAIAGAISAGAGIPLVVAATAGGLVALGGVAGVGGTWMMGDALRERGTSAKNFGNFCSWTDEEVA